MIVILYLLIVILGLIIGSFLNVLIYRYPLMLKNEWQEQAHDILDMEYNAALGTFNLFKPDSHCPHCQAPVKPYQNIPLISYLFLKGKCASCKGKISCRYPFIEVLSALLAIIAVAKFGMSWTALAAAVFSWGLLTISCIDIDEKFIPDTITLSLLWIGLVCSLYYQFTTPKLAILGAIAGYLIFWAIAKIFKLLRNKEGLGYGDFKLLAMLGAWLGITSLLNIILMASITGLVVGLIMILTKHMQSSEQIPFGPFLAFAGWCTMLFGPFITAAMINVLQ